MKNNYPNWFSSEEYGYAKENFSKHLNEFRDKKVDFLQIGAYTGDATNWLLNNIVTFEGSTLTDVDTWEGSKEEAHEELNWSSVESVYVEKNKKFLENNTLIKIKNTSDNFFLSNTKKYDFIYVDGDHTAMSVLKDGINSYDSLKIGGILSFDDYLWDARTGDIMKNPKPAIDALLLYYKKNFSVISIDLQVWLRKIS